VVPKWARKALAIQGGVTVHAQDDPNAEKAQVGQMPHLNIVLKGCLCATCNNEWLADIEKKVQPLLEPMVVSAESTMLDPAAQELLALWAVKTCLLLELAFRQRYPGHRLDEGYQATPQELAWLQARNEPPPRSMVWLGCWDCQQTRPVTYEPSGADLPTADGVPVTGHMTTYTLGFVAFQVFTVDFIAAEQHRARSWNLNPPEPLKQQLPRIWPCPPTAQPVAWPPPMFRTDDWRDLVTWNGALRPEDPQASTR
jgi:hypothetical protein